MKKLTFEIRSPAHQQNAIHAVQQILPDPTKPIVVTIQERNRSLDQNRKLWACLGDVSRQVEWHGRWLDAESWKCVFTAALKQQDVVPNLAGNGFVVIGQSTSRMRVQHGAECCLSRVLGLDVKKGESLGSAVKRYMSMNTDAAPAQDSTPSGEPRNQVGSYTSKSGIQFTVE